MSLIEHHRMTGRRIFEIQQQRQMSISNSINHVFSFNALPSEGSLMLVFLVWNGTTGIGSSPSGWTLINNALTQTNPFLELWYKIATANESNSYNWTVSTSPPNFHASGVVITDQHATTPYEDAMGTGSGSGNVTSGAVNTVNAKENSIVLVGYVTPGLVTHSFTNGYTDLFTNITPSQGIAFKKITSAGNTTTVITWGGTSGRYRSIIVEINPRL